MAGGINIPFLSDVRDFLRGTKNVEGALDDVADALDDVGTDAKTAGRDLDRGLGDGAKDAAKSADRALDNVSDALDDVSRDAKDAGKDLDKHLTEGAKDAADEGEKMERSFRDAFDAVRTDAKKTGDDVGTGAKKGFTEASEATQTFKDEAKANLSETVSSFRGDAEDIPQIFQDVFGGVVADLGPAGMVGGALAAAGIGIAVSLFQKSAEESEALKEKLIDLAGQLHEVDGDLSALDWGAIFQDFGNEIADAKSWFEPWQDAAKTNYEQVKEYAEKSGVAYATLFQGMAGDSDMARDALADLDSQIATSNDQIAAYTASTEQWGTAEAKTLTDMQDKRDELVAIRDELKTNSGLTDEAIEYEKLMADAYKGSAAELADKNDALRETIELSADAISSELDYLDALEEGTAKLAENAAAGFDKNTAAGRENLRTLGDISTAALEYSDAISEAGGSQTDANAVINTGRQRLVDAAKQLGMSSDEAEAYATSLGLIPKEVGTEAKVSGTTEAERELSNLARSRSVPLYVDPAALQRSADAAVGGLRLTPMQLQIQARYGQVAV